MRRRRKSQRRTASGLALASSGGSRYTFRDTFNDAADGAIGSTPLTRTCFPGPGTISLKDRNAGDSAEGTNLSYSGGKLAFAGGVATWNRVGCHSIMSFARAVGKILALKYTHASVAGTMLGVTSAADEDFSGYNSLGLNIGTNTVYARFSAGGNSPAIGTLTAATEYDFAFVLQSTGRFILCRVSGAPWKLLWWDGTGKGGVTTTPVYLGASHYDSGAIKIDDLRVPVRTWTPTALVNVTAAAGSDYAGTADLVADLTVVWGTGQTGGVTVRATEAGATGWHVYAHTDGKLKVDKVGGASAGNKFASAGAVFVNGRTETIRIIAEGTEFRVYLYDASATNPWTLQTTINTASSSSDLDAQTLVNADAAATATFGNLTVYDRVQPLFNF